MKMYSDNNGNIEEMEENTNHLRDFDLEADMDQ